MQSADLLQVYKRLAEKLRQNPYWQVNISELRVQAATGRFDLYAQLTASRSNKA